MGTPVEGSSKSEEKLLGMWSWSHNKGSGKFLMVSQTVGMCHGLTRRVVGMFLMVS